jgi:hypothetical protein
VGKATGARFERHVEIRRAKDDLLLAQARSVWAAIDPRTGRPRRIDAQLRLSFYARCLLCLICLIACCAGRANAQQQPVRAQHGMVASASGIASQVGAEILKRGGNAVDAACAVGLALAVTYPAAGNLGGGGFMLIRLADGRAVAIDYRETAPAAAQRTLYLDKAGNIIPNASLVGYRAAGVPGTVAGLGLAQHKYGVLKWREVVEPARRLAAQGFPISHSLAAGLRNAKDLARFPASRNIFLRDGRYYAEGETFKQPELAATLERLAEQGPREFYTGRTAQLVAEDMRSNGGLITLADLQNYKAVERKPLRGSYRGYEILTMPPPSSGGAALLEMLNILEPHDLAAMGYNSSQTDHLLIEAMRRACITSGCPTLFAPSRSRCRKMCWRHCNPWDIRSILLAERAVNAGAMRRAFWSIQRRAHVWEPPTHAPPMRLLSATEYENASVLLKRTRGCDTGAMRRAFVDPATGTRLNISTKFLLPRCQNTEMPEFCPEAQGLTPTKENCRVI